MLKQKKKPCISCGDDTYIFSKGKCRRCSEIGSKGLKSGKNRIKHITEKKLKEKQETREIRDEYFEHHINLCTHSEESGKQISNPTRANICHIFDKSRHPSLQANLENFVYLSFEEHQEFDKLLYSHKFERLEEEFKNSFEKACIRGEKLLSLCQENTVFMRKFKKYLDGRK